MPFSLAKETRDPWLNAKFRGNDAVHTLNQEKHRAQGCLSRLGLEASCRTQGGHGRSARSTWGSMRRLGGPGLLTLMFQSDLLEFYWNFIGIFGCICSSVYKAFTFKCFTCTWVWVFYSDCDGPTMLRNQTPPASKRRARRKTSACFWARISWARLGKIRLFRICMARWPQKVPKRK